MNDREWNAITRRGVQIVSSAREGAIPLLLTGSAAIDMRCPAGRSLVLRNQAAPRDIDLVCLSKFRIKLSHFMALQQFRGALDLYSHPYTSRDVFWGMCDSQLVRADVVYDYLSYVYVLDVRKDFDRDGATISLQNLLMSKLQIRELGLRDIVHICAVLLQCSAEQRPLDSGYFEPMRLRTGMDYRCERDFENSLMITSSAMESGDILLEAREREELRIALLICLKSLAKTKHGAGWWIGRAKASMGINPPEPEEDEEHPVV